jgi:hypothetical protein
MLDQLTILKLIAGRLDAAGIAYMLTGSLAAGAYSRPRTTRDIDLVVELEPADADRLAAAMGDEFSPDPESIRTAVARRGMFNLIHRDAIVKVDFVVRKNTPYRVEEFNRRRLIEIDRQPIWIVSPEDLILSKLVWARDGESALQMRDVRELRASLQGLDMAYLRRWADELGVGDLLEGTGREQ